MLHDVKDSELCYWIDYVEQWQKLLLNAVIKETNMPMPFEHVSSKAF